MLSPLYRYRNLSIHKYVLLDNMYIKRACPAPVKNYILYILLCQTKKKQQDQMINANRVYIVLAVGATHWLCGSHRN